MILIDNILADEALLTTQFLCDTHACKGACCTLKGGRGAPLLDEEVQQVMDSIEVASAYLSERSRAIIDEMGAVEGTSGSFATRCIRDRDCVFVFYEGEVAKCAIEKAYFEGKTSFRKPVSCHLFPARVADFGGSYLYYEEIPECKPALKNGKKSGVYVYQMLKEALIRAFGTEWYEKLAERARKKHSSSNG